jgi:hypothetical protein
MQIYQPPLDQLLTLGEPRAPHDYRLLGIGPEQIPELIRMMTDAELNEAMCDTQEVWAPLHAWRALGQLQASEAVGPFLDLMARNQNDDWIREDCGNFVAAIGPPALPVLERFLTTKERPALARWCVAEAMANLALKFPDLRQQVVATLIKELEQAESNPAEVNAAIAYSLMQLGATEAEQAIRSAYALDRVDEFVVGRQEDFLYDMGLGPVPGPIHRLQRYAPILGGGDTRTPKQKAHAKNRRQLAKASRKRNRKRR